MKVFITGASGFVGGAAAAKLIAEGHTVMAMSRSTASDEVIRSLGAISVRCDLMHVDATHLSGCEVVIHAGAFVGEWGNYQTYHDLNVTGTENMLAAAKAAGIRKFIHISTESVLFAGQDLLNVNEDHPYTATPFYYSKTKQLAEQAVRAANAPGQMETICLRPRLIWGPGDKTILPLLKAAVDKGQFIWIGHGNFLSSTTHIHNLTHAIGLAIDRAKGGSVFFITDDETPTLFEFCSALLHATGTNVKSTSMPKWLVRTAAYVIESLWHLFGIKSKPPITRLGAAIFSSHCTIDISKAKNELGYAPVVSIKEGIEALKQTST